MDFLYIQGGAVPPPQAISVQCVDNISGAVMGPLGVVLADSAPWLELTPEAGQTPYMVEVSVHPAGLAPGQYTASIVIEATGEEIVNPSDTIGVSLRVFPSPPRPK